MVQVIYRGITFHLVTFAEDPQNGPYYYPEINKEIRIYSPKTDKNPSEKWRAINEDNNKTWEGTTKNEAFHTAAIWILQKEKKRKFRYKIKR